MSSAKMLFQIKQSGDDFVECGEQLELPHDGNFNFTPHAFDRTLVLHCPKRRRYQNTDQELSELS